MREKYKIKMLKGRLKRISEENKSLRSDNKFLLESNKHLKKTYEGSLSLQEDYVNAIEVLKKREIELEELKKKYKALLDSISENRWNYEKTLKRMIGEISTIKGV